MGEPTSLAVLLSAMLAFADDHDSLDARGDRHRLLGGGTLRRVDRGNGAGGHRTLGFSQVSMSATVERRQVCRERLATGCSPAGWNAVSGDEPRGINLGAPGSSRAPCGYCPSPRPPCP